MTLYPAPMPVFFLFLCSLLLHPGLAPTALADTTASAAFADDLDFRGLDRALAQSRRYYDTVPDRLFSLCGQHFSGRQLSHAYGLLENRLLTSPPPNIASWLAAHFSLCDPAPLLVTGYYTPILAGSLSRSASHPFPLYGLPPRDELRTLSRAAIAGSRALDDHVIAYVADPVDLFFLHVQGSGILTLPDTSRRLVAYAGSNGRPYTSIGKVLIEAGKLGRDEVSLATIKTYLQRHPEQQQEIFNRNERFIYFRLVEPADSEPLPAGSLGLPLTPGRSVALDDHHYPPGVLGLVTGLLPQPLASGEVSPRPFRRLVTHHDSGAAITGPHRLDLYLGSGAAAGEVAGRMKDAGSFMLLIPKELLPLP
jgi:membrane-bound lytic murein transglycosylase A